MNALKYSEAYLKPCQTFRMDLFVKKSERLSTIFANKLQIKRLLEFWIRPWYGAGKVHILTFFTEFCGKSDFLQTYVTETGSSNAVLKNNCSSWMTYPKGYTMINYFSMIKKLMIKQWIKQSTCELFCNFSFIRSCATS